MYFYWRIQLDLSEIGNILILQHPGLIREFKLWAKRNAGGLALAEGFDRECLQRWTFNPN